MILPEAARDPNASSFIIQKDGYFCLIYFCSDFGISDSQGTPVEQRPQP